MRRHRRRSRRPRRSRRSRGGTPGQRRNARRARRTRKRSLKGGRRARRGGSNGQPPSSSYRYIPSLRTLTTSAATAIPIATTMYKAYVTGDTRTFGAEMKVHAFNLFNSLPPAIKRMTIEDVVNGNAQKYISQMTSAPEKLQVEQIIGDLQAKASAGTTR